MDGCFLSEWKNRKSKKLLADSMGVFLKLHKISRTLFLLAISAPFIYQQTVLALDGPTTAPHRIVKAPPYRPTVFTKEVAKGKALYAQESCSTCHSINGKGGCIAPPLDAIGARRTKRFILSRITDTPAAISSFEELYKMPELMPHLRVSEPTAKALTKYLMTLPAPRDGFKVAVHKVSAHKRIDTQQSSALSPGEIEHGKRLFYERGCIACHSIGDIGGTFAPRLDGIRERRDKNFVSTRISDAEFFVQKYPDEYGERGTIMVPSNLNEKDIRDITEYLMTLPKQK